MLSDRETSVLRAIDQQIAKEEHARKINEMLALTGMAVTYGYTAQGTVRVFTPIREQAGDSSDGINPCGYGEL